MSNIETLEQDTVACELCCPHGAETRERALEEDFVAALRGSPEQDHRIAVREGAAKTDLRKRGAGLARI